jgi:hypothetical protein
MAEDFFDDTIDDGLDSADFELEDEDGNDDEDGDDEIETRSVVLAKEDMIALLGLKTSNRGGLIVRMDPRQDNPAAQTYDDREAATMWFNKSLRTSKKNGWVVVYDGQPAFG